MDECRFDGGYTIVKDYVRAQKRGSQEMFVPLSHPPWHGQADFGEALVVIGGFEQKAYFFAFDLPHSEACYIRAYPAANTEAWPSLGRFGFAKSPAGQRTGMCRPLPSSGQYRAAFCTTMTVAL